MPAYSLVMVLALVVVAALVIAYLAPPVNTINEQANKDIAAGRMSEQTAYTMKWHETFLYWSPVIAIIGFAVFLVVRSIETSEPGG